MHDMEYWSMTAEQRMAYDRAALGGRIELENCRAGNGPGFDITNATPTPMDRQIRNELERQTHAIERVADSIQGVYWTMAACTTFIVLAILYAAHR